MKDVHAIAYEGGKINTKTTKLSVRPIIHYNAENVQAIRKQVRLTQTVFTGLHRNRRGRNK